MILQALARYYQRLAAQPDSGLASYGYSPEKISYAIVLDADGRVMQVDDVRDTSGKQPRPGIFTVPQPPKRTVGIQPSFLWDKTSYVLGVSASSKRADKEHAAFKSLHLPLLADSPDAGLLALCRFLQQWQPDQFQPPLFTQEMKDANVMFRLSGENGWLHERPAARALRAQLLQGSEPDEDPHATRIQNGHIATCLLTGEAAMPAATHPSIKGVVGAQSSGASIVSFNQGAFTSYGKEQGENAPVSVQAAFAYTTALNHLLRSGSHRIQIGDATVVFWAEAATHEQAAAAESLLAALLAPPDDASEARRVQDVLSIVQKGRPLTDAQLAARLDPQTRICVLGLAPNAARLSVRFWLTDSLQELVQRLAQHEADLRLEPLPWQTAPAVRRLVLATAPQREGAMPKSEDAIHNLVGETMRAILTGGPYPLSLLSNTVMRMRADGHLSGLRVALCKGVITRQRRLLQQTSKEEIPVSLNTQSTEPGYLLGRLFAVLEYAQRGALGKQINATIRDRYYGAASATPASIFPVLLRNAQNHISKIRKDKAGFAVNIEKLLNSIIDLLPEHFPKTLNIENQGRFAIGYYHQNNSFYTKNGGSTEPADIENVSEPGEQE